MLITAAVCPHPPVLVPRVAGGAAADLARVRAMSVRAAATLGAGDVDIVYVVGGGARTREHAPDSAGSLRGYGVDVSVGGDGAPALPLSLTIGGWLLERAGVPVGGYVEIAADAAPERCLEWGRSLAASAPRVAVLAMGDGSARLSESAPGYVDHRAAGFDARVAAALAAADAATLAELDAELCADLWVAGRPAWQALSGAAEVGVFEGALLAHAAPYGVGYFVAQWHRTAPGEA